jgi:5-formyltetrahydrofolate cyclo-ligase
MAVPSPSKSDLRTHALAERRAFARSLPPSLRAELEAKLVPIVLPRLIGARVVAGYHPLKDEISPQPILEGLVDGQVAAFPWFAGRDSRMMFRQGPAVEPAPWGVLQPTPDSPAVAPDAVLVPLVLADRQGVRIGHGKGHYDRALSNLKDGAHPLLIGIAWDMQISEVSIPADPWDMHLDAIATPSEWIDCR